MCHESRDFIHSPSPSNPSILSLSFILFPSANAPQHHSPQSGSHQASAHNREARYPPRRALPSQPVTPTRVHAHLLRHPLGPPDFVPPVRPLVRHGIEMRHALATIPLFRGETLPEPHSGLLFRVVFRLLLVVGGGVTGGTPRLGRRGLVSGLALGRVGAPAA